MNDIKEAMSYQQYFSKSHDLLRKAVRDFVKKEITPHVEEWEEEGAYPKELYKKIADLGYNAIIYPEEYGGAGGDWFEYIVALEEFCRCVSF